MNLKGKKCLHHGKRGIASDGFRGGRAGSRFPLGDRLSPSLTVLLMCDNGTVLW